MRGFEISPPNLTGAGRIVLVTWERNGDLVVESIDFEDLFPRRSEFSSILTLEWRTISQPERPDLDSAYFDSLLGDEAADPLNPEDSSDIVRAFIRHLFHPGRFSMVTLETALDEYISRLPRQYQDSITQMVHPSLSQRMASIVGCRLNLEANLSTGAPMVSAYRRGLKREWLGIWARARDLDRRARWPLGTAICGAQFTVLARESMHVATQEDAPQLVHRLSEKGDARNEILSFSDHEMSLYPSLIDSDCRRNVLYLSAAGAFLNATLAGQNAPDGSTVISVFDSAFESGVAGATAQSVEDFLASLWEYQISPFLSQEDWELVKSYLDQTTEPRLRGIQQILDLLRDFDETASEERVATLILSWYGDGLVASAIAQNVSARYHLSRMLLLVALFEVFSESSIGVSELRDDQLELMANLLTFCHRYTVLQEVCDMSGEEDAEGTTTSRSVKRKHDLLDGDQFDDRSQHLDRNSSYSLLHRLLERTARSAHPITTAAHSWLDELRIFKPEPLDAEPPFDIAASVADANLPLTVLEDGHPTKAIDIIDLYPRAAVLEYVRGRSMISLGRTSEGVEAFQAAVYACLGGFTPGEEGLLVTTDDSLGRLVPTINGLGTYYRHLTHLLSACSSPLPVIHFAHLAIAAGGESRDVYTALFLSQVSLGLYEDAYTTIAALSSTPHLDLRKECLAQLISVMCEHNEVGRLNALGFVGCQKEVEDLLSYKARNSDPFRFPNYYKVLYSWHTARGDYRSGE